MNDDIIELTTIAAEHRRDFTAAQAIESDLDLAYRLQLEEAITASLAFQPSSSNSGNSPPPPIAISDDVNLAGFQTLELDKFETEIKDRMIIKSETKKLRLDLNRRIHDQKLAREIARMPEEEWQIVGDDFERPFGEGGSSSNNGDDLEVFRVYFKGLWSHGMVRGSNIIETIAGIGVAICDSMDEMIFEMSKPLDLVEGDRISRNVVEGQALVEALNAATSLDLKRIEFYCDFYPLYQFVIGEWWPKYQKIIDMLDKVDHFRSCFTYCEPVLIASRDVKFAFKLAREAINSQIRKRVRSSLEKLENCVICLDDKSIDQFFSVEGCTHKYCLACVKQHVEVKLLHGVLPKCPHEGCQNELRLESCEKFLTPKFIEMMKQRLKEDSIPVTQKVYCPYPKCSTLMSIFEVFRLPRLANRFGARRCYKCRGIFCMHCRVPWHANMNCAQYKRRNPTPLVEESKLKNLAAMNMWRQCIKCKHMIELAAGCYHMTCRCGYEFCYTCGAEWKNKKATCTCPLWDEENIVESEEDDDDNDFEDEGVVFVDDDDDDYDSDEYFL